MNFCRRCGSPLEHLQEHVYRCDNQHTLYANSSPAVGVFFLTPDNRLLLCVRGIEPHKGALDAFGGFVGNEETYEQAAAREIEEEAALRADDYDPLTYLGSAMAHYPYGGETLPALTVLFWTRLMPGRYITPRDDAAAVQEMPLGKVDFALLHDDDIREGVRQLQNMFNKS